MSLQKDPQSKYLWLKLRETEELAWITQLLSDTEDLYPGVLTPKPTFLNLVPPCTHLWQGTCWHHPSAWPGFGKEKMGCCPPHRWHQSYSVQSCQGCRWQHTCHLYYHGQQLFWVFPLGPVHHKEALFRMLSKCKNRPSKTLKTFCSLISTCSGRREWWLNIILFR
jgi:hypothetical protein